MKARPDCQVGREARQNASDSAIVRCLSCGRGVPRKRRWQAFCSPKCRKAAWLISHRTGTYTDVRQILSAIQVDIARIKTQLGIKGGTT